MSEGSPSTPIEPTPMTPRQFDDAMAEQARLRRAGASIERGRFIVPADIQDQIRIEHERQEAHQDRLAPEQEFYKNTPDGQMILRYRRLIESEVDEPHCQYPQLRAGSPYPYA